MRTSAVRISTSGPRNKGLANLRPGIQTLSVSPVTKRAPGNREQELVVFCPTISEEDLAASAPTRFALYLEGPRDRDILRNFAHRLSPRLARAMDPCVRILGGRRPARAVELFRDLADEAGPATPRGICILDRDTPHPGAPQEVLPDEPKLDFVVWGRRHIESYLVVPEAIRRCLARKADASSIDRFSADYLPQDIDEEYFHSFNAKHLLAGLGPIARTFGRPLRPRDIVHRMLPNEIHPDVRQVLATVSASLSEPAEV